jgi:hypothetical protein
MLFNVCAAGVGVAFSAALPYIPWRRLFRKPTPPLTDVQRRWLSLDRRTRRDLVKRVRRGREVPVQHAAIVIELIDRVNEAAAKRPSQLAPTIFVGIWSAFVFAFGWHLRSGSGYEGRFEAFFLMALACSMVVRQTWRLARGGTRRRGWQASSTRTREQAERNLAAIASGESL